MADIYTNLLDRDIDPVETRDWLESLAYAMERHGADRVRFLLNQLTLQAQRMGSALPFSANTPYINTIHAKDQPPYPGSREIERRIKSIVRWNAMAMVVRANQHHSGIGGHISTYASAATLYEIGFNHFFRGAVNDQAGDQVYFQGHSSPGMYARAFLEGRLSEDDLNHFRAELGEGGGLPSYPHPRALPAFWQFPTVSMGLGPILAIYQARFNRYLHDRGLLDTEQSRVWAFLGDGETDEPESLGALTLASRERLDNLIFVVNCNLQRLDGPVRGNGKIIQELEAAFKGAGWNVIKVIWGDNWDPLLAADSDGILVKRMGEVVDGQYQKYVVEDGAYIREHFFGAYPELLALVSHLTDEQLLRLRRGGHDPDKVYAAYLAAVAHRGSPTVILAKTIKGYGLGEAGEGKNVTHQQKKLNEAELREFRTRFGIPISDEAVKDAPFYRPPEDSPEMKYLRARREALGGSLPARAVRAAPVQAPPLEFFHEFLEGTGEREVSTTMAFVRMLSQLLREPNLGKLIVPIIPDEARTFGMEPLFRQCGIYSRIGQVYEPVDRDTLLYYKEAVDGQILMEGINEAGSLASFVAAGTAYATHGVSTIPFFTYYSMFGFQRVGDLIWAAADMRCRGFLMGGTAGRTTLQGEGLQHQDGHSHLLVSAVPCIAAYDPAFAYELAVIIQDGLKRMFQDQEDVLFYITMMNENYAHPPMPAGAEEGIRRGMYLFRRGRDSAVWPAVQLCGSGTILREVLRAQALLEEFKVRADVWSVTSYGELRRDALACVRWNRLHPGLPPRVPYVTQQLADFAGPLVAASDYVKTLPHSLAPFLTRRVHALGTDGFGRSDTREALRRYFEIDAETIALAALHALAMEGAVPVKQVAQAVLKLGLDPEKADPLAL